MNQEYECAIVKDDEDFMSLVEKVEAIATKYGLAEQLKWGQYDVWNDYNKIVLTSLDDIKAEAATYGWRQIYAGVVLPEGKSPLQTISTSEHYSVQYNDTKHLEIFYEDIGETTYEEETPWGFFVKEVLELLAQRELAV